MKRLAAEASFSQYTVNFLNLLIDQSRVEALEEICESFEKSYCKLTDTQVGARGSAWERWGAASGRQAGRREAATSVGVRQFSACVYAAFGCIVWHGLRVRRMRIGTGALAAARLLGSHAFPPWVASPGLCPPLLRSGGHSDQRGQAGAGAAVPDCQEAAGADGQQEHQAEAGGGCRPRGRLCRRVRLHPHRPVGWVAARTSWPPPSASAAAHLLPCGTPRLRRKCCRCLVSACTCRCR